MCLEIAVLAGGSGVQRLAHDPHGAIHADEAVGEVSRLLTGACLEDAYHEVSGGTYSQMIFGESFQEPAPSLPPRGFEAFGGAGKVADGELRGRVALAMGLVLIGEAGVETAAPRLEAVPTRSVTIQDGFWARLGPLLTCAGAGLRPYVARFRLRVASQDSRAQYA